MGTKTHSVSYDYAKAFECRLPVEAVVINASIETTLTIPSRDTSAKSILKRHRQ
jgi:hypothetical protein